MSKSLLFYSYLFFLLTEFLGLNLILFWTCDIPTWIQATWGRTKIE